MDMDRAERLFKMHQEIVKQEAEAAFNGAMARAQSKMVPIINNAYNAQTSSRYAKLAAINKSIVPIYTAEGLSISFNSAEAKEGLFRTIALVSHEAGHTRTYYKDLPLDNVGMAGKVNKTELHALGSTSSYSRRYLVCEIFNLSTEDDDDGNAGGGKLGPEPDAEGEKLLRAAGSLDALKKAWSALTVEQRKSLNEVMGECRRTIEEADKQ